MSDDEAAEELNERANTLAREQRFADAEVLYRRAIALEPGLAKAHSNLGTTLRNQKQWVEAEQSYRRAIELGGSALAYKGLTSLLFMFGRAEEALSMVAGLPAATSAPILDALARSPVKASLALRVGAAWLGLASSDARALDGVARTVETVTFGPALSILVPRAVRLITPFVLKEQGDWFEDELPFVRALMQEGEAAVDVGANFGVFTLSIAKAVGSTGAVVAFEPSSATVRFLEASARENGFEHVIVVRAAVSSESGEATFTNTESPELSGLDVPEDGQGVWREVVPLETLESVDARIDGRRVTFLKVDAEGEEVRILEGGAAFIQRHDPLLMTELRHQGQVNHGLIAKLRGLGLTVYRLVPGLGVLEPLTDALQTEPYLLNVFACSESRAATLAKRRLLGDASRGRPAPHSEVSPSRNLGGASKYAARAAALFRAVTEQTGVDDQLATLHAARAAAERAVVTRPSTGALCLATRIYAELGMRAAATASADRALAELATPAEDLLVAPTTAFDAAFESEPTRAIIELSLLDYLLQGSAWSAIFDPAGLGLARRILSLDPTHARAARVVRLATEAT